MNIIPMMKIEDLWNSLITNVTPWSIITLIIDIAIVIFLIVKVVLSPFVRSLIHLPSTLGIKS